jgi:hypothetical protein
MLLGPRSCLSTACIASYTCYTSLGAQVAESWNLANTLATVAAALGPVRRPTSSAAAPALSLSELVMIFF